MSNVIPIVSSSPPPLDDDADFKWEDDDDDEYGTFTCAPTLSTTTVNSDSSIDTNWSNSQTPVPPHGPSLGKDLKTWKEDLSISGSDRGTSEHTSADNHDFVQGTQSHLSGDLNTVDDDGDNFEDFARFDNVDFSEGPADEATDKQLDSPHDPSPSAAHTESPAAHSGQVSSTADVAEEDEFQDFAQFNGDVTAENSDSSATSQPVFTEHSPEVNKLDTNSTSSSNSTCDDIHGLGLDLASENGAPRAESAGSAPLKNSGSIHSSVSTVDSGLFSGDLSPSCQSGEPSDIYLNVDKEDTQSQTNSVLQNDDKFPHSDCLSSVRPPDNAASLAASDGHCEATAAVDIAVSEDALEIHVSPNHSNNISDGELAAGGDNLSSSNAQNESASCDTADDSANLKDSDDSANLKDSDDLANLKDSDDLANLKDSDDSANLKDSEHFIENLSLPGKEEIGTTIARSGEELEHSFEQTEASNHSTVSTSDVAGDFSPDGSAVAAFSSVTLPVAGCGNKTWGDDVEGAQSSIARGDELEDKIQLNIVNVNSDVHNECNTDRSGQSKDGGSSQPVFLSLAVDHEKSGHLSCGVIPNSKQLNKDISTCDLGSPTDVGVDATLAKSSVLKSKEAFDDAEDSDEDKEFGDFSSHACQQDDDTSEVAPIMFRTSICEPEVADDDVDDFTFDRERPPVFDDDDDDEFGEFGAAGPNISDERNNNEFNSAQKVQPNRSTVDTDKGVRGNDDDDFGDFDESQPADDGASWADFGSAVTQTVAGGSSGSVSSRQVVTQASVSQSQAQKLQNAVISCFLVGSEGDSCAQQAEEDHGGQSADDHGRSSVLEDESPLPLDMVVDLGLSKALEAQQQTWTLVQHPSKKDPKVRLWAHLKDMDSSHALMYGWHSSHCSKEVYTSLHIDTQNILFSHKKQAVPFFASGLGILEPIRGGGGGGGGVVERKKEKSTVPATQTVFLDNGRQEYRQSTTVQDIPPVDFDWSSSGLTNPLTANTLDLDFLVIQGGDSSEKASVFKVEDREAAPPAMQPLEDILKRTTPTARLATSEVLSPEAVRVLQRMPDLSFMQSRVLMFPVKQ